MMLGYKSNNNVVYSSKYHVIWCPKYRRKVLVGDVAKRLEEIIRKTALRYRADIIALEIMPDWHYDAVAHLNRIPSDWIVQNSIR
jgi:putative transposase